jgi:hypothetical protein
MEFCTNCGQPLDPVTHSCPVCGRSYPGAPVQAQAPVQSGFVPALKQRIGSGLLLALSILSTVSVVISFFNNSTVTDTGFNLNFNILGILYAVAFWMIYAAARSGNYGMSLGGLKFMSVITTIARVVLWIIFGVALVIAILCFVAPSAVYSATSFTVSGNTDILDALIPSFSYSSLILILGVLLVIVALVILIVNVAFFGNVSKSIKSVIASVETDQYRLEKLGAVTGWLIVIGCIYIVVTVINSMYDGIELMPLISNVIEIVMIFMGAALASKVKNTPVPYSQPIQYNNY